MDTIKNISLGGFAFTIDETAYRMLQNYLNEVKKSLKNTEDANEILYDVEQRLAELLKERLKNREVVDNADVEHLIGIMGKPEQFRLDDEQESQPSDEFVDESKKVWNDTKAYFQKRKLYRDSEHKKIGGVLAGVAHFFKIDATWLRILILGIVAIDIFLLGGIFSFPIFIAYMILWLVVPETQTTSDRLEMEGKPVNIDTIKEHNEQRFTFKKKGVFDSIFRFIGEVFRIVGTLILYFFMGILLIVALALFIAFVASIFGLGVAGWGVGVTSFAGYEYLTFLFDERWKLILAYISTMFVLLIPVIALILGIVKLVSKDFVIKSWFVYSMIFLFIGGLVGVTFLTATTANSFKSEYRAVEHNDLPMLTERININFEEKNSFGGGLMIDKNDNLLLPISYQNNRFLRISPSKTNKSTLRIEKESKGRTQGDADTNISNMKVNIEIKDNEISIPQYVTILKGKIWRAQQVKLYLELADSTEVHFNKRHSIKVYSTENEEYETEYIKPGTYRFINGKWECVSCEKSTDNAIDEKTIVDDDEGVELELKTSVFN